VLAPVDTGGARLIVVASRWRTPLHILENAHTKKRAVAWKIDFVGVSQENRQRANLHDASLTPTFAVTISATVDGAFNLPDR
jgi:hypothetical protein